MPKSKSSNDDSAPPPERVVSSLARDEDEGLDRVFRPTSLDDFVGQEKHKSNLRVYVQAARKRHEPLDHILLCGPPGLGKTTLAYILAKEMGVELVMSSGPAIEHKGVLSGHLTRMNRGDILFIDEVHRLSAPIEEALYPAMEDFRIDVMTGAGAYAEVIPLEVKPFTLIGATTRTGLLTKPLQERFGVTLRLDFYPIAELERIVLRNAALLEIPCEEVGARALAARSRGTPRVANRLLRRVRDFAEIEGNGRIDQEIVELTCSRLEIDTGGLDEMDRRLLGVLIEHYDGGPVGVETLAAALAEPRDTIEDVYEPYLLQQGFLGRTPRGRVATRKAYQHLGLPAEMLRRATSSRIMKAHSVLPGAEAWSAAGSGGRSGTATLVHGFTGNPASMRPLAETLANRGFHVELPRLPGHGTRVADLMRTRYDDWRGEVMRVLDEVRSKSEAVLLIGLSGGGTLALDVAQQRGHEIAGLVTINAQILDREGFLPRLAPVVERLIPLVPSAAAGLVKNDIAKPMKYESAYSWVPTKAAGSFLRALRRIRAELPELAVPALIAYAPQDHSVPAKNSKYILQVLGPRATELVLDRSYHVATLDYDAPLIEERITEFADAVSQARKLSGEAKA